MEVRTEDVWTRLKTVRKLTSMHHTIAVKTKYFGMNNYGRANI